MEFLLRLSSSWYIDRRFTTIIVGIGTSHYTKYIIEIWVYDSYTLKLHLNVSDNYDNYDHIDTPN